MDYEKERIVSRDPEIVSGALVFAGTRVPVKNLIDYIEAGHSLDRGTWAGRGIPQDDARGGRGLRQCAGCSMKTWIGASNGFSAKNMRF